MRAAFTFRGQLHYANRAPSESPTAAAARSLKRRLGADVTLSFQERDSLNRETWLAAWFDAPSDTYQEAEIHF